MGPEELCSAPGVLSMETSVWERPRCSSVFVPLRLWFRSIDELLAVRDRARRVILAEGTIEKKA